MKNSMFSGWKDVFLFTLKQGAGQKYRAVTIALALILFAGGFAANVFMALSQQKENNISPIETVYVIDESEIADINWVDSKQLDREQFPNVKFEQTKSEIAELGKQLMDNETTSVIAKVEKGKEKYIVNVFVPYGSDVTKDDGENLAKVMDSIVYEGIIKASSIDADKVTYVVSTMDTEFRIVGENAKSDNMLMVTSVFPVVFMMGLYFMVIIYGQNMGQIVSIEKSTKLMETLLVMTRPYGLIFGKIIATASTAILQMAVWIGSLVAGFFVGDGFARNSIYGDYDNFIISLFKDIAAEGSSQAFTPAAIVLTAIAVCLAFFFYCMLAGATSSFASKADELGTTMMFYNMSIVIGFLGSYIIPMAVGQEWVKVIIRLVPMSGAFILPGEILLGTVKTGAAVVYLIVLFAWILLTAIFAGKIYRDQVFHRGQSLKERLPWLKKKASEESDEQWQYLHDEAGRPLEKSQKIGYFFIAISPLVIFFIIQILGSLVVTNIMTRVDLRGIDLELWEVKDFADYYHGIESTLNPLTLMVCHLLIIITFGIWMYFIRRGIDKNNIIHVKNLLGKKLVTMLGICLVGGLCLCALANGVVAIEAEVVPSVVEDYMEMAGTTGFGKSPFAIFAAVCLAPIGEEFLCRGICMNFGKKAFGKFWYANILQALLFGVLHMNWVQGVYAFFIGLVLGILVERYDSLLPAMLVHFVVNFSSSTWVPKVLENVEATLVTGILLVVIPGAITAAMLYFSEKGFKKKIKE